MFNLCDLAWPRKRFFFFFFFVEILRQQASKMLHYCHRPALFSASLRDVWPIHGRITFVSGLLSHGGGCWCPAQFKVLLQKTQRPRRTRHITINYRCTYWLPCIKGYKECDNLKCNLKKTLCNNISVPVVIVYSIYSIHMIFFTV